MRDGAFTVDELVGAAIAEDLEDGRIPIGAVLVVETMTEAGPGVRFYMSDGMVTWHAIGLIRSVERRIEAEDLDEWLAE